MWFELKQPNALPGRNSQEASLGSFPHGGQKRENQSTTSCNRRLHRDQAISRGTNIERTFEEDVTHGEWPCQPVWFFTEKQQNTETIAETRRQQQTRMSIFSRGMKEMR